MRIKVRVCVCVCLSECVYVRGVWCGVSREQLLQLPRRFCACTEEEGGVRIKVRVRVCMF